MFHQQAGIWRSPGKLIIRNLEWLRPGLGQCVNDIFAVIVMVVSMDRPETIHYLSSSIKGRAEILNGDTIYILQYYK